MVSDVLLLVLVKVKFLTLSARSGPLLPKLSVAGCTDTCETTFPEPVPKRVKENGKEVNWGPVVLTASAPSTIAFTVGWKKTLIVQLRPP